MLKVFGNIVLRKIFGHKRDGGRTVWNKSHEEEHNDLYSSSNNITVN
jgi:hypothetical protein